VNLQLDRDEEWEGIECGTTEACRGGVTTIIDSGVMRPKKNLL